VFTDQTQLDGILKLTVQQTAALGRADLLQAARAVLIRAREINPLNTDHSANLARLHRTWADLVSDPAQRAKLTDQALEYYVEATSLSPHNAILWNEWATVDLYLKGDPDAALKKLERSIELDAQFDQTYLILAGLYMSQKDLDKAAEQYQKAIAVQPNIAEPYLGLGDVYMNKNDLDKAAEAYRKALTIRPDLVQAQSVLAYIYSQQGKLSEAIQTSLSLIKTSPNDPNIWNTHKNLALLYAQTGNLPAAIEQAQIAATKAPSDTRPALQAYIAQLQAQMAAPPPAPSPAAPPAPPVTTTSAVTK